MSKYKSCGANIVWIKTSGGKRMPCDAEPLTYRQAKGGSEVIVTPNGEVLRAEIAADGSDNATGIGYRSHFTTCPNADIHRKRK